MLRQRKTMAAVVLLLMSGVGFVLLSATPNCACGDPVAETDADVLTSVLTSVARFLASLVGLG